MARYLKTQFVTLESLTVTPPRVGQWVNIDGNVRGQYLGVSAAGVIVVRYEKRKFNTRSAYDNAALRQFALGVGRSRAPY